VAAGQATYENQCMQCHGTPGAADGTAPDLAGYAPLPIHDGVIGENHPEVDELTPDDYGNLAAYLAEDNDGNDGGGNQNVNDNADDGGQNDNDNADDGNGDDQAQEGDRIDLNVVKLTYEATTERGPAVGDGVLAFDAEGGATLAWVRAGETEAFAVPAPADMGHDREAFEFAGRKLVVRDRYSGALYVFDTDTEQVTDIPYDSINMGGIGGPNVWEADGNLVATVNSWVTTENGAHKIVKVVDVSDITALSITPFDVDPVGEPDAIDVDAEAGRVVVRAEGVFYVYDVNTPSAPPDEFARPSPEGGVGWATVIRVWGIYVAFFDDEMNFTLLNVTNGEFTSPARNPSRDSRGLTVEAGRFACFLEQTEDDGSDIAQINRAIFGDADDVTNLMDPVGVFINGTNDVDGRVGFGATVAVSPDGRYVFVAGETAVGVDEQERLYISIDGENFQIAADADDSLNALRAAGVAASNNLVAFLIPAGDSTSAVSIGYATLPP
jgi:hypothetical protein